MTTHLTDAEQVRAQAAEAAARAAEAAALASVHALNAAARAAGRIEASLAVATRVPASAPLPPVDHLLGTMTHIAEETDRLVQTAAAGAAPTPDRRRHLTVVAGELRHLAARSAEAATSISRLTYGRTDGFTQGRLAG